MHHLIILVHLITLVSSQSASSSSSQSAASSSSSDPPVSELEGVALYEKLKADFPGLCPNQPDGTPSPKPSCTNLTTQLAEMTDHLLAQNVAAAARGLSDLSSPSRSRSSSTSEARSRSSSRSFQPPPTPPPSSGSDQPPPAPPPSSNSATGEGEKGRDCQDGIFASLLRKIEDLKAKIQGFDFRDHYFAMFVFSSVIMILLLISQTYHCCLGHIKDHRVRVSNREAQRANNLYHNLQRIHQGRPLLQVNSGNNAQNQGTGP